MNADNRDEFDEVVMWEERSYNKGYSEGFEKGFQQALSYDPSGCTCGVEATYELAMYQAFLTIKFNNKLTKHVTKMLQDFKTELESFNFNSLKEISDQLKSLKINYNKLCGALMLPNEKNGTENADTTF